MANDSRTAKSPPFRASACVRGSLCTLCHHDNASSMSEWVYPFHLVILSDQHGSSCVHAGRVQTSNHTKSGQPTTASQRMLHHPCPIDAHTVHLFMHSCSLPACWHWCCGGGGCELVQKCADKVPVSLLYLYNGLLKHPPEHLARRDFTQCFLRPVQLC